MSESCDRITTPPPHTNETLNHVTNGMGIADLWPVVAAGQYPRVPFLVFLSRFVAAHGRPPRLAIDAYMFLFYSMLPDLDPEDRATQNRLIHNFMAKLWYFVRVNVSFVVVFDGRYKPGKLRHGHIPHIHGSQSYDELLRHFLTIPTDKYSEESTLSQRLKDILLRNRMDYVQAPGDAEAECAWLQRLGVVDYVVSDDSDCLVFGAFKVLRLFNRFKEYVDDKPQASSEDYYVTPVHMDRVTEATGLDRGRLVLLAILRGNDFSTGAEGIGITRAKEIALCGSTVFTKSPRKKAQDFGALPNFAGLLLSAFVNRVEPLADPWHGLKSEMERAEGLEAFFGYLTDFLKTLDLKVFGRRTTLNARVLVDDYNVAIMFFPFVNRHIFKFMPFSTSFGELAAAESDLACSADCKAKRINYVCSPQFIGYTEIVEGTQVYHGVGRGTQLRADKLTLPNEKKANLRSFVVRLLSLGLLDKIVSLSRTKDVDGEKMAILSFSKSKLAAALYNQESSPGDEVSFAVPYNVLQLSAPWFTEKYRFIGVKRISFVKRKPSLQKTTLDKFWTLKESPERGSEALPKRSPSKRLLSPGQQKVTSYFQKEDVDNPFLDQVRTYTTILQIPLLRTPFEHKSEPEISPTKRRAVVIDLTRDDSCEESPDD